MRFRDREDAGRQLGERLSFLKGEKDLLVLGIPRGGVVVAGEVARALDAPLDVFIAHKIGAPLNPELALGALTSTGQVVLDDELIEWLGVKRREIDLEIECQREEIARRLALYRQGRPPLCIQHRVIVVVDDGVATGSTMLAALSALRAQEPAKLVLAVPVGPPDTLHRLGQECDQVVALYTPDVFFAVGRFYGCFEQTADDEILRLLEAEWQRAGRN